MVFKVRFSKRDYKPICSFLSSKNMPFTRAQLFSIVFAGLIEKWKQ